MLVLSGKTNFDKIMIHMKNIDENDARWYVNNDNIYDGLASVFVGNFYTVAGMPVGKLWLFNERLNRIIKVKISGFGRYFFMFKSNMY